MNKVFSAVFVLAIGCFLCFSASFLRAMVIEEVDDSATYQMPGSVEDKIDEHLNGEVHYSLSDEYQEVIKSYDLDLSLAATVSLMDQYHNGKLTFIGFYDNRKDSEKQGGGVHLVLKLTGRYQYFILSKFELMEPYSHGYVHNTVKLYIGKRSELFDSDMTERFRGITYVLNGAMNKGHIIDQYMISETYPGVESHGDSVEVLLPRGQWVIDSPTYYADGRLRTRRFDPNISSFLYKRKFLYDSVFLSLADYFRDSPIEALVTNRLVQVTALSAILSQPKIFAAAVVYLASILEVTFKNGGQVTADLLHRAIINSGAAPAVSNAMVAILSLLSQQLKRLQHHSGSYLLRALGGGG